jgi:hypothetical protein
MKQALVLDKKFNILSKILKFNGSLTEKLSIFYFLSNLKKLKSKNTIANNSLNFLKYEIIGIGNNNIKYLFNEIFLNNEYYFFVKTKNQL